MHKPLIDKAWNDHAAALLRVADHLAATGNRDAAEAFLDDLAEDDAADRYADAVALDADEQGEQIEPLLFIDFSPDHAKRPGEGAPPMYGSAVAAPGPRPDEPTHPGGAA